MNNLLHKVYYILIPALIIGISFGYTSFDVALVAFLPLLFMTNRHTVGVFFILYGSILGGVIRAMHPSIPIYGVILVLIGFILVRDLIADLFRNNLQSLKMMALLLAVFGVFYLIGPGDEWAINKYTKMCSTGMLMIVGYHAFNRSNMIDAEGLFRLLFVAAICMYAYVIHSMNMTPAQIFNYNWFRDQSGYINRMYKEHGGTDVLVNYQHIGMMIAYSIAILLSKVELKKIIVAFYIICGMHATLMSGCRQAIFAILIVVTLRMIVFTASNLQYQISTNRIIKIVIGIILAFFIIWIFLENVQSEAILNTLNKGDSGRQKQYLDAWNIFLHNPLFGAGIGGYQAITGDAWPHNFFLEALCELGIIGTIIIITILVGNLIRNQMGLFYLTESNIFYFLVITILFIRIMVSADFRESIELFSAIFAISATIENNNYFIENKDEYTI